MIKTKLSILFLALGLTTISNAEYVVKVPLENFNGGTLPNNSISFVTNPSDGGSGNTGGESGGEENATPTPTPDPETPTEPVADISVEDECGNETTKFLKIIYTESDYALSIVGTEITYPEQSCVVSLNLFTTRYQNCVGNESYVVKSELRKPIDKTQHDISFSLKYYACPK